jgi:hypothetical protein
MRLSGPGDLILALVLAAAVPIAARAQTTAPREPPLAEETRELVATPWGAVGALAMALLVRERLAIYAGPITPRIRSVVGQPRQLQTEPAQPTAGLGVVGLRVRARLAQPVEIEPAPTC